MVKELIRSFHALKPIRAFVIGDFVVDAYIIGAAGRISPEAPVPVLHAKEKRHIPGMAGNVALNLISLGAQVSICGRIGDDLEGQIFINYLKNHGVDTTDVVIQAEYDTPVKQRMIANAQQLLRVDFETLTPLSCELEDDLINRLPTVFQDVDIVAVSDYKKGFLTNRLIQYVIQVAKGLGIPVIVDPKGNDFSKYYGCSLIKPNLQEAYHAAKCDRNVHLGSVAKTLLVEGGCKHLLVTRSEEGMSLFDAQGVQEDFHVQSREVKDVTGAGDTVLAMMAMGMGNGLDPSLCAQLANLAASVAVQKLGCVRVTLSEVAEELLLVDHSHKIFAEDHLFALKQALIDKHLVVLGLDSDQTMTIELFQAIKKLTSIDSHHRLLLYVKSTEMNEKMIELLASLKEVNFILLGSEKVSELFDKIAPVAIFQIRNDVLRQLQNPAELLESLLRHAQRLQA